MRTVRRVAMLVLLQIASAAPAFAGEVVQVKISDLAFTPAEITIHLGDTVEWVNDDFIDHTATATRADWDLMVLKGKSAQMQLTRAGAFDYFCRFHPNMTGKIRVVGE